MPLKDDMVRTGDYLFRWRSYLPLLFLPLFMLALADFKYIGGSATLDCVWEVFCLSIAAAGLALRILTVGFAPPGTSGRNTRRQRAGTLNTTGMYSIVRHPLYLGNFLIWLSVTLFAHTWWLVLIGVLAFCLYYERIMLAEEAFLKEKFKSEFEEWARRTPTFIPTWRSWQPPTRPFSWKTVLARENPTLFAIITVFFLLELAGDFFAGKMPHVDLGWIVLYSIGSVSYITLRWLKKHKLLSADTRSS
ncbi:MAG TPA: isoprenylcysteine carboxylmethyltransferase family protein [Nitrococcus sp.]|nr:isoprenylcysteine carboxylmethyltransferase family protein [Nitrococcus sp.]